MKIRITITKDVLNETKYCGPINAGLNCAIAVAVRDMVPQAKVRTHYIAFFDTSWNYITSSFLPPVAVRFIKKFDTRSPEERVRIKPISFDLDIPDEVIERIGIDQIHKILSESKTLEYAQ
jgi:hypothetical protein